MTTANTIQDLTSGEYKWGFVTPVDEDNIPQGLSEDTIRLISAKKNEPEFMLEWRLKAYRHWARWNRPSGAEAGRSEVSADRLPGHRLLFRAEAEAEPKSLDEVDPKILEAYRSWEFP